MKEGEAADVEMPTPAPQDRRRLPIQRKMSISEEAQSKSTGRLLPPPIIRKIIETPFRTVNPTTQTILDEATGWAMDAGARGPLNQTGAFVGSAILRYALIEARCEGMYQCEKTVYGLHPGSLLTTATVATGILSAIFMPIIGAIVDHTSHRKIVGVVTAILVSAITGAQIMISEDTWFAVLILEAFGGFALIIHTSVTMAYLPDISYLEKDLAHYTSHFNMLQYIFQMLYVGLLVGLAYGVPYDSFMTAKISAAASFAISFILFGYSWMFLFRKRPALSKVPEGENIINTGFRQIGKTAVTIWTKYSALKWFMIALLWSPEAGAGVVLSIAVTFLTVQIQITGGEIGIITITLLIFTIPGSIFAKWFMMRYNPLQSFRASLVFFAVSIGATCIVLDNPNRKNWTYLFAALLGIAYGWVYPSQRVMQVTLIPKGQNNEMMGFFSFCSQILGWLPALLFSIMNENGVDMRWGMALIPFFICLSIVFTIFIGDYDEAVAMVAEETKSEENGVESEKM